MEILSILAFFVTYKMSDIYMATIVLMVSQCLILLYKYFKGVLKPLDKYSTLAILIFGGMTVSLRDPIFIQYKPTVFYGVLGSIFLISELLGKSILLRIVNKIINSNAHSKKPIALNESAIRYGSIQLGILALTMSFANYYVFTYFLESQWVTYKMLSGIPFTIITLVIIFRAIGINNIKLLSE